MQAFQEMFPFKVHLKGNLCEKVMNVNRFVAYILKFEDSIFTLNISAHKVTITTPGK